MSKVIKEKGDFILLRPSHSWDMNYHLIDRLEKKEYLIDICDVYERDEIDEGSECEGILWEELRELGDIPNIIHHAWKVIG